MTSKIIEFKSLPKFYVREKYGFKPNTVRNLDLRDNRIKQLIPLTKLGAPEEYTLLIRIKNSENCRKYFTRKIIDVSVYKDMVIISWEHSDTNIKIK